MNDYVRDGARLTQTKRITALADGAGYTVLLSARDIRRERTGIHARIDVVINGVTLAYSTLNIEKDEDRVRLANSAFRLYRENGLAADYSKEFVKKDLDVFCDGLWDETLAVSMPERMAGAVGRTPPGFLLRPYVLDDGGTLIFAPPGQGKSYSVMLMAVSLDAGLSTLWPVRQTPVLFVNLERSRVRVADRLGNVNEVLGLPRARPLHTLNARGRGFLDVLESIERYIEQERIGCLFLDSVSRAGMGDLNENQSANRIIDALNRLGISWLAIGHTPRNDATHLYGSVHFEAGADVVVRQISQQDGFDQPLGIGLEITKANDIPKYPTPTLALEFDAAGLSGIRTARVGEFPEIEESRATSLRSEILQYVLANGASTATTISKALGRNRGNVSGLLSRDPAFCVARKTGREVFYGAVG